METEHTTFVLSNSVLSPALFVYILSCLKISACFAESTKKRLAFHYKTHKTCESKNLSIGNPGKVWLDTAKQHFNRNTEFLSNSKRSKTSKLKLSIFFSLKPKTYVFYLQRLTGIYSLSHTGSVNIATIWMLNTIVKEENQMQFNTFSISI